ncbi:MAG: TIGR01777 family oxidoreductase, partial [Pyrinomonadaceae bacterium]
EVLTEQSPAGDDFLARVCVDWESAFEPLATKSIRTVLTRFGIVLSSQGGALAQMLTPFKLGVGGKLGSGDQYMSWITLVDAVGVIRHALDNKSVTGPINSVAPTPVTNSEFTAELGKALSRPALLTVPAFALSLMFGEIADAGLLASLRVVPERLTTLGYKFRFPELGGALKSVLG